MQSLSEVLSFTGVDAKAGFHQDGLQRPKYPSALSLLPFFVLCSPREPLTILQMAGCTLSLLHALLERSLPAKGPVLTILFVLQSTLSGFLSHCLAPSSTLHNSLVSCCLVNIVPTGSPEVQTLTVQQCKSSTGSQAQCVLNR